MQNKKKIEFMKSLFCYWAGKYNVTKDINFKPDQHCVCAVSFEDKGINFYYNQESISELTKWEITEIALHELGHLINDTPYNTEAEKIDSEFFAEQFAVNVIKEHYPKILGKVIAMLVKVVKSRTTKKNKVYQEAYKKITEVKELL